MWIESEYQKEKGNISYTYLRDNDTCAVCKSNSDKSPYPSRYCRSDPPDPNRCNKDYSSEPIGLIKIWKLVGDGTVYFNLHEMTPGTNEFGEFEEISIDIYNNQKFAKLRKKYKHCDYDPSLSLDVSPEEAIEIIRSIPFMRPEKENIILEEALDVKDLNLFENKDEWMEAYHKKYYELITMLEEKATVVASPASLFEDDAGIF